MAIKAFKKILDWKNFTVLFLDSQVQLCKGENSREPHSAICNTKNIAAEIHVVVTFIRPRILGVDKSVFNISKLYIEDTTHVVVYLNILCLYIQHVNSGNFCSQYLSSQNNMYPSRLILY